MDHSMDSTIESVDIRMSRIGVRSPGQQQTIYIPEIIITYTARPQLRQKRNYLMNLTGRFKPADLVGVVICKHFAVIQFRTEWELVSATAEWLASMPPRGQVVGFAPGGDGFVVREGHGLSTYDRMGQCTSRRPAETDGTVAPPR